MWLFSFAFLACTVPFWLRNIGGLLLLLNVGIISGGTAMSAIIGSARGFDVGISWMQILLAILFCVPALIGLSRMTIDWTSPSVDDLLS